MASTAISIVPKAVRMMTWMLGSNLRTSSMTRRPSIPAIRTSVTTRSAPSFLRWSNPCSPLAAVRTA